MSETSGSGGVSRRVDEDAGGPQALGAGGGGSNDVTSGGGNGAGIPDGDTGMLAGDAVNAGDVAEDRSRLFPDAPQPSHADEQSVPDGGGS
jgi:hypothetical protein